MWRGISVFLIALASVCGSVSAEPADTLDAYLARFELTEVRAAVMRDRLQSVDAGEQGAIAEALGKLYVRRLGEVTTSGDRLRVESLARELLSRFPGAETSDLRIDLQRAQYLVAERIAERHRLRMANEEEVAEAIRILRGSVRVFRDVATTAHRRVEAFERREGKSADSEGLRLLLDEARRVRSAAMYFTGWSRYYLAYLTGDRELAGDAIRSFGWLLNASGGQRASVDRLPTGMTRFAHVSRAAMGVALCEALRGQDVTAVRWLDALDASTEVPDEVRAALFPRRIAVLASGERWGALRALASSAADDGRLDDPGHARLLAVTAYEALAREDGRDAAVLESIAGIAMAQLVRSGEVAQVTELVRLYGIDLVAADGFVLRFVQGLQLFDTALAQLEAAGESSGEPSVVPGTREAFRAASAAFERALEAEDAEAFAGQRVRCQRALGLSHYYAGELVEAADVLASAAVSASVVGDDTAREDALWYAVVSLDRAILRGATGLEARRSRLTTLYLASFPSTDRAARLLIGAPGDEVEAERAVEVLLSVPRDSAVYAAARERAVQLLYRLYRDRRGTERLLVGERFVAVAAEVLRSKRALAERSREVEVARAAGEHAVHIGRQLLDVLLGREQADAARAREVVDAIRDTARLQGIAMDRLEPELLYRELQIAIAEDDRDAAEALSSQLTEAGGAFAAAAGRLVFNEAAAAVDAEATAANLGRLVRVGSRYIAQLERAGTGVEHTATLAVLDRTAGAGAALWRLNGDEAARDVAIRLDTRAIDAGAATVRMLRRAGALRAAAGDHGGAADAWLRLMAGVSAGEAIWFEARYRSIEAISADDPLRAATLLDQHVVLYPSWGPEPWGERLRALRERVGEGAG